MLKELIKEILLEEFRGGQSKSLKVDQCQSPMIGKCCLLRTYSAGVHFGTLVSKNGQNVVLKDAHRVHYWASACSLSQLAMEGDKKIESARISMKVNEIELDRVIEVIPLADSVFDNLTSNIWKK